MNNYNKIKYSVLFFLTCFYNLSYGQYNQSLPCNKDVFCYPDWCNQRRSIVMIKKLKNGVYKGDATGFLINNAKHDGRPYLMTANHVVDKNNDGTISQEEKDSLLLFQFVFNYQQGYCANNNSLPEPSQLEFIVGATVVSHTDVGNILWGDWILLELNQRVPKEYNSYLNGFSASDTKPNEVSVIHHPRGDIKKYSYTDKKVKRKAWKWTAKKWTIGTLEGGSSGAPWFNSDKRVIGVQSTITFDERACGNNKIQAGAGRFDIAWDDNASNEFQLEHWLGDPRGQVNIIGVGGVDLCKNSYVFANVSDLHTSDNVDIWPPYVGPAPSERSYDGVYTAINFIETGQNVNVSPFTSVEFYATRITLKPGFRAENESFFKAKPEACLGGCGNGKNYVTTENIGTSEQNNLSDTSSILKISNQSDSNFKIYPNPTNGIFHFETNEIFEQGEITIKDVVGKTIYQNAIYSKTKDMVINLSGQPIGLYVIRVKIDEKTTILKLILQ